MPLTEIEREITKTVVDRFLDQKETTPRKPLVIKFRAPEALERLVKCSVLKTVDNDAYLPLVLAFHYCGNADALRLAKESVEVVVRVLQELFLVEQEKTDFESADVQANARRICGNIEPEKIRLGLYLAQEFSVLAGWGVNPQRTEITNLKITNASLP